MEYSIWLIGCDDYTEIKMELTTEQLEFVKILEQKSKEISACPCMPTLEVAPSEI